MQKTSLLMRLKSTQIRQLTKNWLSGCVLKNRTFNNVPYFPLAAGQPHSVSNSSASWHKTMKAALVPLCPNLSSSQSPQLALASSLRCTIASVLVGAHNTSNVPLCNHEIGLFLSDVRSSRAALKILLQTSFLYVNLASLIWTWRAGITIRAPFACVNSKKGRSYVHCLNVFTLFM